MKRGGIILLAVVVGVIVCAIAGYADEANTSTGKGLFFNGLGGKFSLTGGRGNENFLLNNLIKPKPESALADEVEILREWEGTHCGYHSAANLTVTTAEEWERLWGVINEQQESQPELPLVDFDNEILIAVFLGDVPSSGYDVEIKNIYIQETLKATTKIIKVSVEVKISQGISLDVISQPYHIVAVEKTAGALVTFQYTVIEASDELPIAKASAAPRSGRAPLEVRFSSEGSRDPEGGDLTYHWDFGDGETSEEANPVHKYIGDFKTQFDPMSKQYSAVLTVTNQAGLEGGAIVNIIVSPPLHTTWPVAVATATPDRGSVPLEVQFSSKGTYSAPGRTLTYHWDFGDGETSEEANPVHVYKEGQRYYSPELIVIDEYGYRDRAVVLITIIGDEAPIAKASAAPRSGRAPLEVRFSSEGSRDPEGGDLTYHWDFGDGETSEEANPVHVYEEAHLTINEMTHMPVPYVATLIVTDVA
ncbi:MAG: PKD domain-containing protein, partial [archaeon]